MYRRLEYSYIIKRCIMNCNACNNFVRTLLLVMAFVIFVPAVNVSAEEPGSSTRSAYDPAECSEAVVQCIESLETDADGKTISVDVTGRGLTVDNVSSAVKKMFNGNPQLFYIYKSYRAFTKSGTKDIKKLIFTMNMSVSDAKRMRNRLEKELKEIDKYVDMTRMSDEEIALAVHDYIANGTMYDRSFNGSHIYDLYGALVNHKAVCQGYAEAYQYAMRSYGIPTSVVTSDDACHAWNIVKIRGKWYHVDVTWDDPIKGGSATDEPGAVNHDYVLLSTSTLLKKSSRDASRKDFVISKEPGVTYGSMTSKTFENGFWKKSKSAIWYYSGRWYYSSKDSFKLVKYNYKSRSSKTIISSKSTKWPVIGKRNRYYTGSYSYLSEKGNYLYYTTPTKIYRYDMKKGSKKVVAKYSKSSARIYGMKISNGNLYYSVKKAPYGTRIGSLKTIKLK